jgi:hypothetical protein
MEKKKEKQQPYLWKWQHLLVVFLALATNLITWYVTKQTLKPQLEQSKREFDYSTEPKCDLEFVKGSTIRSTAPYFFLTNHGPSQLDDVWLKETLFLVDTGGVHECPDLPHFEYKLYCGSSTSMGSLDTGQHKKIDTDPCLSEAFYLLFSKFSGKLVSRFRLTGSSLASPEFKKDFFFIIDYETLQYVAPVYVMPDEYVGGKNLIDSVTAYINHGPRSSIELVSIQDFCEFYKNPPETFYKTKEGKFLPCYDTMKIPAGTPIVWIPHTDALGFEVVGKNSVKLAWKCDETVGTGFLPFVSQPGVW